VTSEDPGPDDRETAADHGRGGPPVGQRRRWLMSFRASVLAVSLLVGTAAGLMVFKGGGPPTEVASVELDLDRSASPTGKGDAPGTGEDPTGQAQSQDKTHDQAQKHDQGQENDGEATGLGQQAPGNGNDGGPAGQAANPSVLVIHVAGAVTHPGVVRVPSGSRTGDAVDAAGGAVPDADLTAVNLAAPLQDGMMVIVPRIGEEAPQPVAGVSGGPGVPGSAAGPAPAPGTEQGAGTEALVNINTASAQDLDALPRVGPVIAERIIAWRTEHGRFARPGDIDAVPGIGEAMLAALLPLITV
jgi:competence protein ComEA